MNGFFGNFSSVANGSKSSAADTLKRSPNTLFIAMNAAAIPPVDPRKRRRETPSFLLADSAISTTRRSTRRCSSVCSGGANSSFETICVGIGRFISSTSHFCTHFRLFMSCLLDKPPLPASVRIHHVYLLVPVPVGLEGDVSSVRRGERVKIGKLVPG